MPQNLMASVRSEKAVETPHDLAAKVYPGRYCNWGAGVIDAGERVNNIR
jgi:hypothetical protein